MQNVKVLCTTDDPLDDLEYHKKLALEWKNVKVLPSFRPDFVLNAENPSFADYISKLQEVTGKKITDLTSMLGAFGQIENCLKVYNLGACGGYVREIASEKLKIS